MSKQTSILELSLAGEHFEAARIWAREIEKFHSVQRDDDFKIYPANSPIRNLSQIIEGNLVPKGFGFLFNCAAKSHHDITKATKDSHVPLAYNAHHFNFDDGNNKLNPQDYAVYGPSEREAPAFLYNPVSPTDSRFEDMKRTAMDFDVATARLDALIDATGWNHNMVIDLNLIRSIENWANRLVEESDGKPKELPPYGQVDSKYWQEYVTRVAAPLACCSGLLP